MRDWIIRYCKGMLQRGKTNEDMQKLKHVGFITQEEYQEIVK
ncbi:hypothetical protein [Tepidibacter hydrothermalis]|uniref:XkdX family protein n=1 Tax=Tepidibacter hydrothermalis TaxID=3036126 RepID=A0ABY8EJT5_9FIRM|nr:hypothetical protein [Tepidibacter hydrothermalis]WFD12445.1 hypothetical protein P4S50_19900 [Tepidibacter hydrothermalis]